MCTRVPAPPAEKNTSSGQLCDLLTTGSQPHAALTPILFLLGKWSGQGSGKYPTVQPFQYKEELYFWHDGKPYLGYMQRSFNAEGVPMHMESGYIRCRPNCVLEMTVSDPAGICSIFEGTWNSQKQTIEVQTTSVIRTSSAKEVNKLTRTLHLSAPNTLTCTMGMEAVKQPMQEHLVSTLHKEQ